MRKGRIERITDKEIIFLSGEVMETSSSSLHIDCSTACTGFSHPKQLFVGDTINLQMVMLPQPCYSASIIAAIEVKFPDDEDKKNELTPIGISYAESMSWDLLAYWLMLRDMFVNQEKVAKMPCIPWVWGKIDIQLLFRFNSAIHVSYVIFAVESAQMRMSSMNQPVYIVPWARSHPPR